MHRIGYRTLASAAVLVALLAGCGNDSDGTGAPSTDAVSVKNQNDAKRKGDALGHVLTKREAKAAVLSTKEDLVVGWKKIKNMPDDGAGTKTKPAVCGKLSRDVDRVIKGAKAKRHKRASFEETPNGIHLVSSVSSFDNADQGKRLDRFATAAAKCSHFTAVLNGQHVDATIDVLRDTPATYGDHRLHLHLGMYVGNQHLTSDVVMMAAGHNVVGIETMSGGTSVPASYLKSFVQAAWNKFSAATGATP
jgi:hypothetical protein